MKTRTAALITLLAAIAFATLYAWAVSRPADEWWADIAALVALVLAVYFVIVTVILGLFAIEEWRGG